MTDAITPRSSSKLAGLVVGDRVRLARESLGWTQTELSRQMDQDLSSSAISLLEAGRTRMSGPTLTSLCRATGFQPSFFVMPDRDTTVPAFFRSLRSATKSARAQGLAQAHIVRGLVEALETHVRLPEPEVPLVEVDDLDDVESAAAEVRAAWGLGDAPIENVVRTLERHGIVVARTMVNAETIDAFSVPFAGRPIVILGNDKGVTARSRFDAAHELGHLVMHAWEDAETTEAEKQAHRFAAALLLPEEPMHEALSGRLRWPDLLDLKATWGVSIAALLYRGRDIGAIPQHVYVNAIKAMSARGWRKVEPGDDRLGGPEKPVLLKRAVSVAESNGVTLGQIVTESGLPSDLVRRLLGEQDKRFVVEI